MALNTVYTKTAKGVLDVKNKALRLTRELGLLFLAIDGKSTFANLALKTGIAENKLKEALDKMVADGHIKAIESASTTAAVAAMPAADTEDLDFTSPATVAKLNAEAETRVKTEAQAKARAQEAARAATEAKARQETEARARAMAEAKMKAEAQAKAKAEAEAKAANDARAKAEQEALVAANAQAKAAAEARVRAAMEAKTKAEAEARLRATAEALAKQEAEAKTVGEARAREESEARARAETEARAHAEAETRARSTLEAQIKAMAEALAQAEARAKQEAEARVRMETEIKARAEAEARARAEAEARAAAAEAAVSQAQAMAEAAANAKAEVRAKESAQGKGDPEIMARMEEAMKALEEAKARVREEAKGRENAEARAREEAAARKHAETESKTRAETEHKKSEEAEARAKAQIRELREQSRKAREEAEANADAERKAREQAEANADAERKSRDEAIRKAREDVERKARAEVDAMIAAERTAREAAEQKAKQELSTKIKAERKAREEAERQTEIAHKARAEAEKKAREATGSDSEAANKARAEAEASARKAEAALAKALATADTERKARAEAEKRAKTEAVARIMQEKELREKADSEVNQRVAAELKARELAERKEDARYRLEATERARAAAENQKTQLEEESHSAAQSSLPRKPTHWARNAAIGTVVLIASAVGLLQFVPLTGQIVSVQQIMAQRLQQPVTISDMRYALFPTPHLKLERVGIGKLQEIKIGSIVANVWPTTLLAEQKDIDSIEVNSVDMDQNALSMFPGWIKPVTGANNLRVGKVIITAVRLAAKSLEVPVFNADITLERNGTLKKALISDGKLRMDLAPSDQGWRINATASNWRLPFGPQIEFDNLTLTAFIDGQKADIKGIEGHFGRGTITGSASASWDADIRMSGDISLSNGDLGKYLGVFTRDFAATGTLNLTATYDLQAASLTALFNQPRVEVNFNAEKGTLNNVDLVRSIQTPSRDGTRGGKTSFNDLAGSLQVQGKRYAYRELQLTSGPMSATGSIDVAADGELSGRINAELGTKSVIVARGSLNVSGNVKSPLLKP
ncbi:MAG: AsmA-like C-terminal region-containing protein [Burkholderiales bacterium]|nr:AsmA-like C-terminal region-containing protein [Burkholderiales bacterium]